MHQQPISNGACQIYIEATKIRVNAVSQNLQSVQSHLIYQIHQCLQISNAISHLIYQVIGVHSAPRLGHD